MGAEGTGSARGDRLFRSIFLHSPVSIVVFDAEGRLEDMNPAALELFGVPSREAAGEYSVDRDPNFPPEGSERVRRGEPFRYRAIYDFDRVRAAKIYPTRHTGTRVLECFVTPWRSETDESAGFLFQMLDVTERAQAEDELHRSRQMLQLVLDHIPQRVFWKDRALNYLGCNAPFARDAHLGSPADVVGKTDFDLVWRDSAALYLADDQFVLETGASKLDYEEPQAGPGGSMRWLRTSKVPLRDRQGKVFAVLGAYEDITDKKHSELEREALVKSLQQALANVKALSGLLPICASCKKIRDDKGYWNQLEDYLSRHSDLSFSHGICPQCREKLYPPPGKREDE